MVRKTKKKPNKRGPDGIDEEVGRNIRLCRIHRDMSQNELAIALGLTFQQIQKYEKGVNRVTAGRLWQISIVLKVPLIDLYGPQDGKPTSDMDLATYRLAVAIMRLPEKLKSLFLALIETILKQVPA